MINEDGIEIGDIHRPDPAVLESLQACVPAVLASPGVLGAEFVLVGGAIKPLDPHMRVVGPAVTVALTDVDHLTPLTAADLAQPGDVLVIAAGGGIDFGVWGHGLCLAAQASGVAGVVVDGAVVNKAELIEMGVPTFSRGASPATGNWNGGGQVNVPITIGPLVIHPGDVIVADADGVVAIPAARAAEISALVASFEDENVRRRNEIAAGVPLLEIVRRSRRADTVG